jgi:hypothetical protein
MIGRVRVFENRVLRRKFGSNKIQDGRSFRRLKKIA